jgi:hypothetical protein
VKSAAALALVAVTLGACATAAPSVETLAGEWHGRVVTARGHTAARLTVAPNGSYEGTAYFDGMDRPLRGAIVALPDGRLRYVSSEGDGSVAVVNGTLRLRGDDGATGGRFTRQP